MRRRVRRALAACLAAALLAPALPVAAAPLAPRTRVAVDGPVDIDELLQVARVRAASMTSLFYKYTFRQTIIEEDLAEDGTTKRRETSVYDVIPSRDGTERHLVSRDGEPPSQAEIRKQEKRNEAVKKRWERLRARQVKAAAEAKARREAAAKKQAAAPASPAVRQGGPAPASAPASPAVRQGGPAPASAPAPAPAPASAPAPATGVPMPSAQAASKTVVSATASALPVPAPDQIRALPPLPACDLDDLESSLRPALPGSVTRSRRPATLAPQEARRAREKTSDYSLWELLQLTDYEYAGACALDGRAMHVLTFAPPASFDPANPVERVMTAMGGTLLLDGLDLQVTRAEGMTVAPITWGGGMIKLRSARVLLEYGKVLDEIWMPKRDVFEFDSRVVLASERQRFTHLYDDFKKATVEVETEYEYREDEPAK